MHILFGVLSAVGFAAYFAWRITSAARAVSELADTADGARKWFRRRRWYKRATFDAIAQVQDPREAAAAMMVAVAQYDGAMTAREKAVIISGMTTHFQVDETIAEALLARGRWLAQNSTDLSFFLKQLAPSVERICSTQEKHQLINMLSNTARADDDMDEVTDHAIMDLKRRLAV